MDYRGHLLFNWLAKEQENHIAGGVSACLRSPCGRPAVDHGSRCTLQDYLEVIWIALGSGGRRGKEMGFEWTRRSCVVCCVTQGQVENAEVAQWQSGIIYCERQSLWYVIGFKECHSSTWNWKAMMLWIHVFPQYKRTLDASLNDKIIVKIKSLNLK